MLLKLLLTLQLQETLSESNPSSQETSTLGSWTSSSLDAQPVESSPLEEKAQLSMPTLPSITTLTPVPTSLISHAVGPGSQLRPMLVDTIPETMHSSTPLLCKDLFHPWLDPGWCSLHIQHLRLEGTSTLPIQLMHLCRYPRAPSTQGFSSVRNSLCYVFLFGFVRNDSILSHFVCTKKFFAL